MNVALGLLVILLLVTANGLFVAIEFALLASDRSKLEANAAAGSRTARLALAAKKETSFYLSGAQLGITMTSLVLGFLAEPLVGQLIDPVLERVGARGGTTLSVALALLLATVFQMVVGELIPKNIAITHPERVAQSLAPISRVIFGLTSPLIRFFNGAANWSVRRLGIDPKKELASVRSIEELDYLIQSSGKTGALRPDELSLLRRTIRFGDKTAAEALTPRVHIEAVSTATTVGDLYSRTTASGHTHYPVYGEDLDDIKGVVTVTAMFDLPTAERQSTPVVDIMKPAHAVPETRNLIDLLDDFRTLQAELLIVVDEHGGTDGIITLEDVLEEITGDIDDEYDNEEVPLTVVRRGVSVVAGTLNGDEVGDASGFELPEGDYETIAGFLLAQFGHLPVEGEQLHWNGWLLEVVEMDRRRIASVQLVAPDVPRTSSGEALDSVEETSR
ncbi:MAG: CBS domain containing-hemolysin-like protein [Acidimicrobiales bacterium]|jgi:CBS domain containing-hemolysin-like protein